MRDGADRIQGFTCWCCFALQTEGMDERRECGGVVPAVVLILSVEFEHPIGGLCPAAPAQACPVEEMWAPQFHSHTSVCWPLKQHLPGLLEGECVCMCV